MLRSIGRLFLTSFRDVQGGRIDPIKVLYLGKKAKSNIFKNTSLQSIAHIVKGQSITSNNVMNGSYPVIAGGKSSPYSHNVCNFEGNVITVSASGAYAGFVWYHNEPIFASDCNVIYSRDESKFRTRFLFEVLKAQQSQIYLLQQGAGQPHVYSNDLNKMQIPIVSPKKQDIIIRYIEALRNDASSKIEEAFTAVKEAQSQIESMIMGD